MPTRPFIGIVKYEARNEPDKFGRINVAFEPGEEAARAAMQKAGMDLIRVNAKAEDQRKVAALRRLGRGEKVYLFKAGTYEGKPYFDFLVGVAPNGVQPVSAPNRKAVDYVECLVAIYEDLRERLPGTEDRALASLAATVFISETRDH